MTRPIRVALVNDYMIVLEGLRALLKPSAPEIEVVEMDVRKGPKRRVDVTLLDTYGELGSLDERVRSLGVDSSNGAIVVFSFSDRPEAVRRALRSGAQGFISKAVAETDRRRHPSCRKRRPCGSHTTVSTLPNR